MRENDFLAGKSIVTVFLKGAALQEKVRRAFDSYGVKTLKQPQNDQEYA
jgi:hypothetical protein